MISISAGYATGVDLNRDIWKMELRGAYDVYFIDELSGGPELSLVKFSGSRNGFSAATQGITAAYILKWLFLKNNSFSLFFEHGWGFAAFANEFPPQGTKLNGNSLVGLGMFLYTSPKALLLFDARLIHHSNGKGLVENNPAFDGILFHIGYGFNL